MERTEALDGLDVQAFYDTLAELRQTMTAAAEAEDAPAATDAPVETGTPALPLLRWAKKIKMTGRTASAVRPVFDASMRRPSYL